MGTLVKKVTFDTQDSLDEKIDRLSSMVSKLTAQDDDQIKQFKPKIYQSKRKGQTRNFYMVRKVIKVNIGQIVEIGEYHSVAEYNMNGIIGTDQGII